MSVTARERRASELYYGGMDRRALCNRVAQLEDDAPRHARRVIVSDEGTDNATCWCACGACAGTIDPYDSFCRHCGARMEDI